MAGTDPDAWYDCLEHENDQLRAALRRLSETDAERGLELACVVWPYWVARGRLVEGREWLTRLLARAAPDDRVSRLKALHGAGVLAFLQGESDVARELLNEALRRARVAGNRGVEADALIGLARVAMFEQDARTMERYARESSDVSLAAADERRFATALHHVAEALRRQARYDEASRLFRDAIERHRTLGDRRSIALELHNLARLERQTGEAGAAVRRFRESLAAAAELKHERLVAYCLLGLATLAAEAGDLARAMSLVGAADARLAAVGAALEPEYADEREQLVTRAERALGQAASARERDAGSALSLEESALLGLDQPR